MEEIRRELIERAAIGDINAFEDIYLASSGFVYSVALRVTGEADSADEVTQEVFISLFKGLKDFRFQSSFKTWLYRVTSNAAINYSLKSRKEDGRRDDLAKAEKSALVTDSAEKEALSRESEKRLSLLLGKLNPDERLCIVLREIEGLSYKEMADALSLNINTIRTRLKRAREKLISKAREEAEDGL